jgi:hypothetical protein
MFACTITRVKPALLTSLLPGEHTSTRERAREVIASEANTGTVPAWLATPCSEKLRQPAAQSRHTPGTNKHQTQTRDTAIVTTHTSVAKHRAPVAQDGEARLARYHVRRRQNS